MGNSHLWDSKVGAEIILKEVLNDQGREVNLIFLGHESIQ
jgi:hypothetical protein